MHFAKKDFKAKFLIFTFLISLLLANNTNAVQTYYTDNDYESTSVYADVGNKISNNNMKTATTSKPKTVNTNKNEPRKILQ